MSTPPKVLAEVTQRFEVTVFDTRNEEHIKAFQDLQERGRQSTKFRFKLEAPYLDVRSMMMSKLASQAVADYWDYGPPKKTVVRRVRKVSGQPPALRVVG